MTGKLIIDGDIPIFQSCAAAEMVVEWGDNVFSTAGDLDEAISMFEHKLKMLREVYGNPDYVVALSDGVNFRKEVYPEYKSHRKGKKPMMYQALVDYVIEKHPAARYPGLEGDDVVGLLSEPDDVMVSIDKDLLTVPGIHLNPDKNSTVQVGKVDAIMAHMRQTLAGDRTDGYPGCPSIGDVRAARLLAGTPPHELWETVVKTYEDKGLTEQDALTNARCAYILHHESDYNIETNEVNLWTPENLTR